LFYIAQCCHMAEFNVGEIFKVKMMNIICKVMEQIKLLKILYLTIYISTKLVKNLTFFMEGSREQ